MQIRVRVTGREDLQRAANRLARAARGGLQPRLTTSVRDTGRPALGAVRSAWQGVQVTSSGDGGESSGLRARVAAATESRPIGQGVAYDVNAAQVDPRYGSALVLGLDALRPWVHPVFGIPGIPWERQTGQEVFYRTLQGFEPRWRSGLEQVCDQLAHEIEG